MFPLVMKAAVDDRLKLYQARIFIMTEINSTLFMIVLTLMITKINGNEIVYSLFTMATEMKDCLNLSLTIIVLFRMIDS